MEINIGMTRAAIRKLASDLASEDEVTIYGVMNTAQDEEAIVVISSDDMDDRKDTDVFVEVD